MRATLSRPDLAAASVLLAYTASASLPQSFTMEEALRVVPQFWRTTSAAALPAVEASNAQFSAICSLTGNWDGYGGLPLHLDTQGFAKRALSVFQQHRIIPDLTPNPNGTISFEWSSALGTAHFELGRNRYVGIIRPNASPDMPVAGQTATTAVADLEDIASTIVATLFQTHTTSQSKQIYVTADERSAA
jgi:hypothetical protein